MTNQSRVYGRTSDPQCDALMLRIEPDHAERCSCGLDLAIWQNSWNHRDGCSMKPVERPQTR